LAAIIPHRVSLTTGARQKAVSSNAVSREQLKTISNLRFEISEAPDKRPLSLREG
jgi:hypothetical protein